MTSKNFLTSTKPIHSPSKLRSRDKRYFGLVFLTYGPSVVCAGFSLLCASLFIFSWPGYFGAATIFYCILYVLFCWAASRLFVKHVPDGVYKLSWSHSKRIVINTLVYRWLKQCPFSAFFIESLLVPNYLSAVRGTHAQLVDPWKIIMGKNVTLGAGCVITGHLIHDEVLRTEKIVLGDHSTIGINAVIFPGTIIEPDAIVGAGAVVTSGTHIKRGEVWVGAPARKVMVP